MLIQWVYHLSFNLFLVNPVYVSLAPDTVLTTEALWTTLSVRHFPWTGQVVGQIVNFVSKDIVK